MMSPEEIREAVRERYGAAARESGAGGCCRSTDEEEAGCCGSSVLSAEEQEVFGASRYDESERSEAPDAAVLASLGCGNPTAVANLGEARPCSTSVPERGSTCCCRPGAWDPRAGPTAWR